MAVNMQDARRHLPKGTLIVKAKLSNELIRIIESGGQEARKLAFDVASSSINPKRTILKIIGIEKMTNEEKMRQEFEEFYLTQDTEAAAHLNFIRDDGEYGYHVTRMAWYAWKASREALVIEMPEYLADFVYNDAIEDCRESIHAAGVKTE